MTWQDLQAGAQTVWGEARGEPHEGKLGVACVIMNRARRGGWWGSNVFDVCHKKWQFSCWNADDPNREPMKQCPPSDPIMVNCIQAILEAYRLSGTPDDPVKGACHYHTSAVTPYWSAGLSPDVIIGNHQFYVGVE